MPAKPQEKKHLSAKGLLKKVFSAFTKIKDPESGEGSRNPGITISDCLMSGLAIFGMKYPSLLQFDNDRRKGLIEHNLKHLYHVENCPCDTYLRERLDNTDPNKIRKGFTEVFSALQRGKVLEEYTFINGSYLMLTDGTGYFSSKQVHCEHCCEKHHRDGTTTYHHMMLGAAIVHPDRKEVIPLCPEPIMKADGAKKNDCERNASKRFLADFRREHPHLPVILVEDGLAANAPHLRLCQELDISYITVVKPNGNKTLFSWLRGVQMIEHQVTDENGKLRQKACFYNGIPFNEADPDLQVNFIEYWTFDPSGKQTYHNSWVTDIEITQNNVLDIARGGRARWKIENETFNTLKNQGYHFEHNYGHGYQHLSTVLARLMMLAFLIDQAQQISCELFQAVWHELGSKLALWERIRATFLLFRIDSWRDLYQSLLYGRIDNRLVPDTS